MNKKTIIIGFLIGVLATILGATIYTIIICLQLNMASEEIINKIFTPSIFAKRIIYGAFLNLPLFFYFSYKKSEDHAKGILIAIVLAAIIFMINKI